MSTTLQIALALVAVLLLAWMWLRKRSNHTADVQADRIDTLIGWPPTATRVLSTSERVAYTTLVRALPEYMVLAQVPLSRFLSVPKRNSYADWLRRVGYQCVDFVVCDMAAQVVAVVELQGAQTSERSRKRMNRMSRSLKAAQIPMQVWRENGLPTIDAVRAALLPKQMTQPPVAPAKAVAPSAAANAPMLTPMLAPVAAANTGAANATRHATPFDDSARDSSQDEMIELLEPPPSTWFDDLDSDPVPLSKR
jgi:hypothetical protein